MYASTVIGAGFASGQEIMQFFTNYYSGGFAGIIVAGILFSIIGYSVLRRVYSQRITTYDEFIYPALGWFFGKVMEVIILIFMLSVFCIMIAGMGNIMIDAFNISFTKAVVIASIICILVLLTDIRGIVALNAVITPFLVLGIIFTGVYVIITRDMSVFNITGYIKSVTNNWFFSALLYVSYNSITSIVIMCNLLPYLKSRRIATVSGVLGGMVLMVIALVLNTVLFVFMPEKASFGEIPILYILQKYSNTLNFIYMVVLWLAMFTSAVNSGYCFIDRLRTKVKINRIILILLFGAISIPLSTCGFSRLIATLYPIFGYAGLLMLFVIIIEEALLCTKVVSHKLNRGIKSK